MHTIKPLPAVLAAVLLPVLMEDIAMPASQVFLHLLLLQTSCSTEEAACMKLIAVVAVVSVAGEAGRRHHSLGCRRGEEVDHPMLCCKVQLQ